MTVSKYNRKETKITRMKPEKNLWFMELAFCNLVHESPRGPVRSSPVTDPQQCLLLMWFHPLFCPALGSLPRCLQQREALEESQEESQQANVNVSRMIMVMKLL